MPKTTTLKTVRETTKATNKLPKFGLLSGELRQPQLQIFFRGPRYDHASPCSIYPTLTLVAVSN